MSAADRGFSDMYKDAYGFRPSETTWASWNSMSETELDAEENYLIAAVKDEIDRERDMQNAAVNSYEFYIAAMMRDHCIDRPTAIRWDADTMDVDGDMEYLCFKHGLPYGYFN